MCRQRKPRRQCPALGQVICALCCGTKRLTEIDCPSDCPYLASAREHPAAAVKRQQQHDLALLLPTIGNLTERQHQLFFLFHALIARHQPESLAPLVDDDVADAAAAVAATLETAARGIVYEHTPQSLPAQRLARELVQMLEEIRREGASVKEREAATVLRAIEQGARETRTHGDDGSHASYLALMGRLLQANRAAAARRRSEDQQDQDRSTTLIVP